MATDEYGRTVALHEDLRAVAFAHQEQWGERAEHLSVPVDLRDLEDWAEQAAALAAEVAALRATATAPPWRAGPRG